MEDAAKGQQTSSEYWGVSAVDGTRWRTDIGYGGAAIRLGSFDDEILAAVAYDKAALLLRGKGAPRLNFPLANYLDANGDIVRDRKIEDLLIEKGWDYMRVLLLNLHSTMQTSDLTLFMIHAQALTAQ